VTESMSTTIELMWLANLLVVIGCMGLGWLVGWLQQRLEAGVSSEREK
jgi:hypothetical protein